MDETLSIETLRSFCFQEPTFSPTPLSAPLNDGSEPNVSLVQSPDITVEQIPRLYVLSLPDGSVHKDAALYSVHRIKARPDSSDHTLRSIASNLKEYFQFCLNKGLDYLEIPDQERKRPTFQYAAFLRS